MIVRVESVLLEFGVACNMYLGDTSYVDAVHIFKWIEPVVLRRDIDIVYVEQDAAVGSVDDLVEKLPLSHLRFVKFGVAAYVLDRDWNFEKVLHLPNPLCGGLHSFESIG